MSGSKSYSVLVLTRRAVCFREIGRYFTRAEAEKRAEQVRQSERMRHMHPSCVKVSEVER